MAIRNGDDWAAERREAREAAREGRQAARDEQATVAAERAARVEAEARAEQAKVRESAMLRLVAEGVTDPTMLAKGANLYANRHAKPRQPGAAWDPVYELKRVFHEVTGRGLRPLNPRGEAPPALPPPNLSAGARQPKADELRPGLPRAPVTSNPYATSRADHERERAAYRERLRALGLLDPAFGSIPGGGSSLGGG